MERGALKMQGLEIAFFLHFHPTRGELGCSRDAIPQQVADYKRTAGCIFSDYFDRTAPNLVITC